VCKAILLFALLILRPLAFAQDHAGFVAKMTPAGSWDMGNGYVVPGVNWEHVRPESVGYSSARLEVLRTWLKTRPTTSMMAVYKGKVIFEYGDTTLATNVASVRKSVLDILFAAELKNLPDNLNNSTVVQLGLQDKVPWVHPEELANFDQLLTSRSGIYIPNGNGDQDPIAPKRGSEYPGTYFFYNNWDFNALGTAFEKMTHKDIYDALRDDIAAPIGMQDFDRARQKKPVDPNHTHSGYPMWLSTRDMARIGVLMISHGHWAGKQLADADFLSWSTYVVTPFAEMNPPAFRAAGEPMHWGYGRLWWVWDPSLYPGGTSMGPYQGAYSAMGSGGQYITVFPQLDLVVVHKVDIDANYAANMPLLAWDAALDMLLDARCDNCN
jgi:Beta-lactamase